MTLSINAGSSASAAYINSITQQNVVKPTDESVTSSTTLQNDNDLVAAVLASATYNWDCALVYEGGTNGASDLKFQWSVPSGASMPTVVPSFLFTDGGDHGPSYTDQTSVFVLGTAGAAQKRTVYMTGTLIMSTTAGTVTLKWAQNTSSATASIIHAGSYLRLTRTS